MARPRKDGTPACRPVNKEKLANILLDAYNEANAPRDAADMSGHDYAYRLGYVKNALLRACRELGVIEDV